jgi:hypothetical protein
MVLENLNTPSSREPIDLTIGFLRMLLSSNYNFRCRKILVQLPNSF